MPRRGPLTVMGPWAPVAGGLLGLVLGVVAVLFLAGTADSFEERLALVFLVLGLGMLGTSGVLLADEVRMMRQRAARRRRPPGPGRGDRRPAQRPDAGPAAARCAARSCSSWRPTSAADRL